MATHVGELGLSNLLATMNPSLHPDIFVFLTTKQSLEKVIPKLRPKMVFEETEGYTISTSQDLADSHSFEYTFTCRMITLNVHSNLEAVGFMAAVSAKLTEYNISSNVVSGYFHDHLFIAVGKEDKALEVLHNLSIEGK